MPEYDWIIENGRMIDPATDLDEPRDLAILDGQIACIEPDLKSRSAKHRYDATNQIVSPGLIDIHIHGYDRVTPLGIDVDHFCLGRGVTTAVDAGSAGCDTFPGFRAFAAERFRTRLLAFLHISRAGLAFSSRTGGDDPGELETLKLIHTQDCVDCIEANRDLIVGVKIRLSASIADDGKHGAESFERAQSAAEAVSLPLMTHHNFSTVPLEDCPGRMHPGDIYTHCFHGYPNTIVEPEQRQVIDSVRQARETGVLYDIGHGMGSFSWPVAEACAAQGFWPDTISTDIHSLNMDGPVYDMPTVMSRLWHIGMPLREVIKASTLTPARAIRLDDRIGRLEIGREADITVLGIDSTPVDLEDCHAQLRPLRQRLVAQAVWRAGESAPVTSPSKLPNPATYQPAIDWRSKLIVSDSPTT